MTRTYAFQVSFLALMAAVLLASTQIARPEGWPLLALYAYWIIRILIEAGLFVAFAELIGRLSFLRDRQMLASALAAFVSLVPFALSITAMDLILGLPELGGSIAFAPAESIGASNLSSDTQIGSFFREIMFLTDNHLALCILLSTPRIFGLSSKNVALQTDTTVNPGSRTSGEDFPLQNQIAAVTEEVTGTSSPGTGYARHLERPFEGEILRVEAQEHYVRLVGQSDSQMMLYRFNDIVSELAPERGMQVHRSHWVAYEAIDRLLREDGRLWLSTRDGAKIPVSRKYADDVRIKISNLPAKTKKAIN